MCTRQLRAHLLMPASGRGSREHRQQVIPVERRYPLAAVSIRYCNQFPRLNHHTCGYCGYWVYRLPLRAPTPCLAAVTLRAR